MRNLFLFILIFCTSIQAEVDPQKLSEIRQQALDAAVELLKDKNPTTQEVLKAAREFEDYLLNQPSEVVTTLQDRAGVKYEANQDKPYTGKHVEYYSDAKGQKSIEIEYKDGVKDGVEIEYFKNGQKKQVVEYKKGKPVSEPKKWNDNGLLAEKDQDNFDGLSVGLNFQKKSTSVKVSGDLTYEDSGGVKQSIASEGIGVGKTDLLTEINIDYGYQVTDEFLAIMGLSYSFNDGDKIKGYQKSYHPDYTDKSASAETDNVLTLYIGPAYEISNNVLGYAKLYYQNFDLDTTNNVGFSSGSYEVHSYGLGIGMKSQLTKNLFINTEISRQMYDDSSFVDHSLDTGSTIASIGLSYNFGNENEVTYDSNAVDFKGLYVGFSGGLKSTMFDVYGDKGIVNSLGQSGFSHGEVYDWSLDSAGNQHMNANTQIEYLFPIYKRTYLSFGGRYSLTEDTVIDAGYKGSNAKLREKNHYSLFIAPAYQISNNSLGYLKISYHKTDLKASVNYANENAQGSVGKTRYSEDMDGYGISIGLRSELAKNIFSDIEIEHIDYGSSTLDNSSYINWDNQSTVANFNLFYKF